MSEEDKKASAGVPLHDDKEGENENPYAVHGGGAHDGGVNEEEEEESTFIEDEDDSKNQDSGAPAPSSSGGSSGTEGQGRPSRPSVLSLYGVEGMPAPRTPEAEGALLASTSEGGLLWHAQIVSDDYHDPKHVTSTGALKPRRPMPHVRATDFFNSLERAKDGRWIFVGVLNGWPSLTGLELLAITCKAKRRIGPSFVKRFWEAGSESPPTWPLNVKNKSVRATLRAPAWTAKGWSEDSPGRLFWFAPHQTPPALHHGQNIVRYLQRQAGPLPTAERASLFAHRYAKTGTAKESVKDKLTYHMGVLIEWSHGQYATVVEVGWLNGLGGYGGQSNWCRDKLAPRPLLYQTMPGGLKGPWTSKFSEVRMTDLADVKNRADFEAYLQEFTGHDKRFLDWHIIHSGRVRLAFRNQEHIATYLLNYILRNPNYTEDAHNCQTFAADLHGFLVGLPNIEPYSKVNRVRYKPRPYLFMYDHTLCDGNKEKA